MPLTYANTPEIQDILNKKRIRTLNLFGSSLISVVSFSENGVESDKRFWCQDTGSILTLMPIYFNSRIISIEYKPGSDISGTTIPQVKLVCFDNINPGKAIAKIDLTDPMELINNKEISVPSGPTFTIYGIATALLSKDTDLIYDKFEKKYNKSNEPENMTIWNKIKNNNKFYLGLEITTKGNDISSGEYMEFIITTIHGAPSEMPLTNISIAPTDMSGN